MIMANHAVEKSDTDYMESYVERNLGPYYVGALKISDAIRDGARLPELENLHLIKTLIEEHVTVADNREAEEYANKIIMEWKEAGGKTVVRGPFQPGVRGGSSNPVLALNAAQNKANDADADMSALLGESFGGSSNDQASVFVDLINHWGELSKLRSEHDEATTEYERQELSQKLEEQSQKFNSEISQKNQQQLAKSESFHLCAKIIAMGPESPLSEYYEKIMDAVLS